MSYDEKYRKRTLEYRQEGHTLEQTSKVFKVAIITIRKWEKQLREEGNLKKHAVKRPFRKIDPEKLMEHVKLHPDDYLREIAQVFNCSESGIRKALKRLKITRKKRPRDIVSKIPYKCKNT